MRDCRRYSSFVRSRLALTNLAELIIGTFGAVLFVYKCSDLVPRWRAGEICMQMPTGFPTTAFGAGSNVDHPFAGSRMAG
jgi:hypothetical protein